MIAALAAALDRIASRLVPDPFVLALGLTAVVFVAASTTIAPSAVLTSWAAGFSDAGGLAFALQMCLVLVTGHALALSPSVRWSVDRLARLPRGPATAAALVAAVSCAAGLLHWGLGAVAGALLAREIGRSATRLGIAVHYPLLGAAAYCGMAVWHGGLSGSAPLKAAEAGAFTEALVGVVPLTRTLFSSTNLMISGALALSLPLLFALMAPREPVAFARQAPPLPARPAPQRDNLWSVVQDRDWAGRALGGVGLTLAGIGLWRGALAFDLNAVNLLFLFAGIGLQGSLRAYLDAIADGARGAGAIIVQFPFYFGILGVMKAGGLIEAVSDALVNASSALTFPLLAFLSAGAVNVVVPSGGGQWAVQADVLLRAGAAHGVDPALTILAFSYGDAWSNLLQPFWALPLLGIMDLSAREIIGYTTVAFAWVGVIVAASLLLIGATA